jgi:intracellular sulfur oxidation DsrE/DsrF family protein
MPLRPVVVAPPSLSSRTLHLFTLPRVFTLLGILLCWPALAQEDQPRYLAEIELQTAEEFYSVLLRAEQLLANGALALNEPVPVTFVIHGPGVRVLLRQNYLSNKPTVDLAASLSALGVIEIKACETWADGDGISADELQPFVDTVPDGVREVDRLIEEENYLYF